ncbi:alpha/beta hydrolase-fold protein [Pelagicoccus enzymogenes]|uniref:alpha/beta hydrolase n=1 Tax=Pelagicoccus enzymogenes TaxID=2773457 RepID=UPI00280FD886|nr:alpha/beta hydrolase-fold protein [Pelagicoccus enzymogenes]MDQ8197063.1 alpha/beta hydrolase-fold protein [Pelagicoccus enzymogenes]
MKLPLLFLIAQLPLSLMADTPSFNIADWARESAASTTTSGIPLSTPHTRNQHYELNIALPDSYHSSPDKRYPVLYLLDPYWDFTPFNSIVSTLRYDKYIPEIIVVGIGYAGENPDYGTLRQIDYTPVADRFDKESGDAKAFLKFLEFEVIPKVESELRVDSSFRALAGGSLGGLFCLYSMFERPDLFQGYIASSPAILWGRRWILQREIDFYRGDSQELWLDKTQSPLPVRLFMTVGAEETEVNWLHEAKAFDALIANREYEGFQYEFHVMEGYHHGGIKFPTFTRGLPFVFKAYQP